MVRPNTPESFLFESLLHTAEERPAKAAIVADGLDHTFDELASRAKRTANLLRMRGIVEGDRVVTFFRNGWDLVVSIFAVSMAGGVIVVLNPQTPARKLRFVLEDCQARFLMTEVGLSPVYMDAVKDLETLHTLIHSGVYGDGAPEQGFLSLDLVPESEGELLPLPEASSRDLAALIYTSGSTGEPKGVMMTHASMMFARDSILKVLKIRPEDRILNCLPLAFDYGLYQLLFAVKTGATLVLEPSFAYPGQILKDLQEEGVTVFPGVPTLFAMLRDLGEKGREKTVLPQVRILTNTAAALQPDLQPAIREMFPNAKIFSFYGQTECKRVSFLPPELLEKKPTSVGKAIPGTRVFLRKEDGSPARPREPGILHVKGPHVMVGYWGRPEESTEILEKDEATGERILNTRDVFSMDEDGDLYFHSRTDDIIKSRGEKVSPVEVERVLASIEGIREVAVLGVEDPVLGEAVHAWVVTEEGRELQEREVILACAGNLESFMRPSKVHFLPELPKSPNGKVDKMALATRMVRKEL